MRQTVERLIASWEAWLRIVAAMSLRVQRVAVPPCSDGWLVASETTSICVEGGKAGRSPRAWCVLQTGQPLFEEAVSPHGDRVSRAVELGRDLQIRRPVRLRGPQDNPCPEGQRLRRRRSTCDLFQRFTMFIGQRNLGREWEGHGKPPCFGAMILKTNSPPLPQIPFLVQANYNCLSTYETNI
jgi:hypothetical protein